MRARFLGRVVLGLLLLGGGATLGSGCAYLAELLKGVQKEEDEKALQKEREDTQNQLDALREQDPKKRRDAVVALRGKRAQKTFVEMAPIVVQALIRRLRDEDGDVVREAVQTLATFANVQEQDPEEREIDPEQRQRLIQVKEATERALTALPPLLHHPDPEVRWWAALAIYNITVLRPSDLKSTIDPSPVIQPLIAALQDEFLAVRTLAADTLLGLKAKEAVPALMEVLQRDAATEMRRLAAWTLGELGDPQAIPILLAALNNPKEDSGVRWRAARSLGLLRAAEAVPSLLKAMEEQDVALSAWAIYALSQIGTPEAKQRLAQLNAQEAQIAKKAIEEKIIEEKRRRAFLRGR